MFFLYTMYAINQTSGNRDYLNGSNDLLYEPLQQILCCTFFSYRIPYNHPKKNHTSVTKRRDPRMDFSHFITLWHWGYICVSL
jgi:hypothetical protein